ncbi:MAG: metal ABC transporter permease [Sphaerochaetaceae bacterium]|nr:metal ABC transporter permease [Sphaerochaetaceae bacterium]
MLNLIQNYQFFQNAIIASFLASIVCGIIGVIVVEKKLILMSGGIAHTAYGGVGLGYMLSINPMLGALGFSIISSFFIGFANHKAKVNKDIIIALFWSLGMALGILFISLTPGYPPDMNSYLFGNILSVTTFDLQLVLILTIIILVIFFVFYNDWKSYLFDDTWAKVIGMKTNLIDYILLILIALTVVILLRIAGIILTIALLTAPAALSKLFTNKFKMRMILSSIISFIFCIGGLYLSYLLNIPSGACIIILAVSFYFISLLIKSLLISKDLKSKEKKQIQDN